MTRRDPFPDGHRRRRMGRRSVLGLLGAVSVAAGGAWGAAATSGTTDGSARASGTGGLPASGQIPPGLRPGGEFDQLIAKLAADDTFSGTVLLVHRDRPVLARSYGMADKKRAVPNGPDTIFCLGSITKIFTAVAVAQLAQQGKIAYTATLGTYLDGFPADTASSVMIHHMLTHTSGMGDYTQLPGFFEASFTWTSPEQVMDETLEFIRKGPLGFVPGTRGQYSNSAYHVLGAIVAKVSGQSYYDYVRDHVFGPAGMTSSDFYTAPQWRADRRIAHPYTSQNQPSGQRVDALEGTFSLIGSPAGNALASAPDLIRFKRALLSHKLLDPVYTELTLSPKVPRAPMPAGPGVPAQFPFDSYATTTDIVNNHWAVGHSGAAPGVWTNLDWFPDLDWTAVFLSNYDMPGPTPGAGPAITARALITQQ
ncbi:serine hydrolase domain-containing protein [Actinacidiphila bryophytorum]|uniref:CubicO group peptidase, beta-lactamase class C family n=1 Tax=Actinacidiphila bryophytorum TaxID=1436133 RepID=A0A9W4MIA4_9ACTN|nr:serine hydrolase domain-containing protein [Actinacidiphila bryophytorum]MBM9435764.1 beta-lactamase family protein [Actinacidiphila bryophytorum]MBN6541608.1 beta-lactamase family protein [Actinacidiphila bryophytorum]CAG7650348.1 CubicO group peptidase, beta-lactamase class C family [Actinacidiphila bryophytorum]